ncbi:kinase-like domain-containing protein [Suillus subalutaceus]|uniref:kinase-like domain-containing protein n=1 Tax=Suillus subalutaceus TaxID=48586 RepID=UPI001B885F06|nr:kinase-like domain-containing protein [Suillus subalutaceus]KAG1837447.1 kinase-like domain-containing protein [Suillus subalutaceus]
MPTNLYPDIPLLQDPDSESADATASAHTFTFAYPVPEEVSRILPASGTYGPFRVWRVLGEGGYATAMGAQDIATDRLLCLKVFRKDRLKYMSTKKVLLNELEVYKRISLAMPCPAIRFVMGLEMSFQTKDRICLVMDPRGRRPLQCYERSLFILCPASSQALGMNALHEIGIIHRDIKAENILIDVRENARVTDFGLCYVHTDKGPLEQRWGYTRGTVGNDPLHGTGGLAQQNRPQFYGAVSSTSLFQRHMRRYFQRRMIYHSMFLGSPTLTEHPSGFPAFEGLHEVIADLLSGLLHCDPYSRYGFHELIEHKAFLLQCGMSEFSGAYARALEREELPDSLPDLRCGLDIYAAPVWFRLPYCEKPRVSNVDWVKPALLSTDL